MQQRKDGIPTIEHGVVSVEIVAFYLGVILNGLHAVKSLR